MIPLALYALIYKNAVWTYKSLNKISTFNGTVFTRKFHNLDLYSNQIRMEKRKKCAGLKVFG